ncbi:hypothetical protein EDD86DRAFT_267863 [Gorgonomyces haynaldii]|nr:hypothetical protein EDD86DRAFT_267863 [Gorgonomyces haynaldii]
MAAIAEFATQSFAFESVQYWAVGAECLLATCGVLLSIIVVIATLRQQKSAANVIVVTMCVSDLMMCLSISCITAYNLSQGRFALGKLGCFANAFIVISGCFLSLFSLFLLTIERYLTIVFQSPLSAILARRLCAAFAFISVIIPATALLLPERDILICLQASMQICSVAWWTLDIRFAWLYVPSLGILVICFLMMVFCYSHITLQYLTIKKQFEPEVNSTSAVRSTQRKSVRSTVSSKEKALFIKSVAISTLFLTCWTPYFCGIIMQMVTKEHASPLFDALATLAASTNSALNPVFLYAFDARTRTHVHDLLGYRKSSELVYASWDVLKT